MLYEIIGIKKKTMTIETLSGIKILNLYIDNFDKVTSVLVNMGKANFEPKSVPVLSDKEFVDMHIALDDTNWRGTALSMGNPHCVIFTQNIKDFKIEQYGPKFENHSLFPDKINTEFAHIINNNTIEMRVWERGSGETLACGTGACAVACAAVKLGFCNVNTPIIIKLIGGDLEIVVSNDWTVTMNGPCKIAYIGSVESKNLD